MKQEYRAMIKNFVSKGFTPKKIKKELNSILGESSPSYPIVATWTNKFIRGRTSIRYECRSSQKTATADRTIKRAHNDILNDSRVFKLDDIANIPTKNVHEILRDHLHTKKFLERWVPCLLTADQKLNRIYVSEECLVMFKCNPTDFLQRFTTIGEIWIHYYTPETEQPPKQWVEAGKVMATFFWDSYGIGHIDLLEEGKTKKEYYAALLNQFSDVEAKRPDLANKEVLFYHNNTPAHTSSIVIAKLHQLRFEFVPRAPRSRDLAPTDFFFFPHIKEWLARRFNSITEGETCSYPYSYIFF